MPHVLDARTGGNLVAHIKVGETYHQRKEVRQTLVAGSLPVGAEYITFSSLFQGVTHQQWYLFNDFLIEPIDKVSVSIHLLCAHKML